MHTGRILTFQHEVPKREKTTANMLKISYL